MRDRMLATTESGRSYALVFDIEDDVLAAFQRFCERQTVHGAFFYGIGGYRRATLGYYDMEKKQYDPIPVEEQVEVVSIVGNVTNFEGKPRIHAHCVVSYRDGHTIGGHLLSAIVRPTLEVMLEETSIPLQRTARPEIGIALIDLPR